MQRWRQTLGTATTCVHDEGGKGSFLLISTKHAGPPSGAKIENGSGHFRLANSVGLKFGGFGPHSVAANEELCLSEYGLK